MLTFLNDYSYLCHERILQALQNHQGEANPGYGLDQHSINARELILKACGTDSEHHSVFFFNGGTQVNACLIDSFLYSHQSAIAIETGHISCHEVSAIEATGHKVEVIPGENGKMVPERLAQFLSERYNDEALMHMCDPAMLYISHSTELGTVYTGEELHQLRAICDQYQLKIYIDGARMASGVTATGAATIADVVATADAFTLGGTKHGLIAGEALVIKNSALMRGFVSLQKQFGALSAKGFFQGIQFAELFKDGLYWEIGKQENAHASTIQEGLKQLGFKLYTESPTNQLFVILTRAQLAKLREKVTCTFFAELKDDLVVVRLCTSFATTDAECESVLAVFSQLRD